MMPEFNAWGELAKFAGALSVAAGAMSWFRKSSLQEDEVVVESCDLLIDAVSNADSTNKIDLATGKNIREQLTVEQLEDMHRERELRSFKNRN